MIFVAERISGRDVFDADNRGNVARVTSLDVFALVRLDLDQPRNAFAFVRARIVNRIAFRKCSGINAEENEFADKRIAPKFERELAELAVIVRRSFQDRKSTSELQSPM